MAVIKELIRKENNGSISFGNYELPQKTKLADFEVNGDLYKVKTFKEITKLEKNGTFVYESIPGTAVSVFKETADEVSFFVDGKGQTQITLELESIAFICSTWENTSSGRSSSRMFPSSMTITRSACAASSI